MDWDVESQYDCFGARYYDSRIGRWLAVDPLADHSPEFSPYAYVSDNPLVRIDETGTTDIRFNLQRQATRFYSVRTLGNLTLFLDGRRALTGVTLEPPWRWNAVDQPWYTASRIPEGHYGFELDTFVPEHGRSYTAFRLTGTGRRQAVFMHIGNNERDTRGCPLCGIRFEGQVIAGGTSTQFFSGAMRIVLATMLFDWLLGSKTTLTFDIVDSPDDWISPQKISPSIPVLGSTPGMVDLPQTIPIRPLMGTSGWEASSGAPPR